MFATRCKLCEQFFPAIQSDVTDEQKSLFQSHGLTGGLVCLTRLQEGKAPAQAALYPGVESIRATKLEVFRYEFEAAGIDPASILTGCRRSRS